MADPYELSEVDAMNPAYGTIWDETGRVLQHWIQTLPQHHALAIPVALLLGARLIAVTIEAALADHASESR